MFTASQKNVFINNFYGRRTAFQTTSFTECKCVSCTFSISDVLKINYSRQIKRYFVMERIYTLTLNYSQEPQ